MRDDAGACTIAGPDILGVEFEDVRVAPASWSAAFGLPGLIHSGAEHGASEQPFDIIVEDRGVGDGVSGVGLPDRHGWFDDVADTVDVEEVAARLVVDSGERGRDGDSCGAPVADIVGLVWGEGVEGCVVRGDASDEEGVDSKSACIESRAEFVSRVEASDEVFVETEGTLCVCEGLGWGDPERGVGETWGEEAVL